MHLGDFQAHGLNIVLLCQGLDVGELFKLGSHNGTSLEVKIRAMNFAERGDQVLDSALAISAGVRALPCVLQKGYGLLLLLLGALRMGHAIHGESLNKLGGEEGRGRGR